jgi:hypothetical protein
MTDDPELTPEELAAFVSLPRDAIPPAALEERTVGALRARNLVRPSVRYPLRLALAAAAAVLLFLGGFAVGHRTAGQTAGTSQAPRPATNTGQRLVVWF